MNTTHDHDHDHDGRRGHALVNISGRLASVGADNRRRVAAFLVRDGQVVAETPVNGGGAFRFHLAPELAHAPDVFAVLGPKGTDAATLMARADLPRVALSAAGRLEGGGLSVDFKVDDELIDFWWIWCREYTISGTLETAAGCPIGATVTIYNVGAGIGGLVTYPLATVTTDNNGAFTASFNWCSRICWWPCWPVWWDCWPWWWELDILAVVEQIERRLRAQSAVAAVARAADVAPLRQPAGADLMTGVGFAHARARSEMQPDAARTALVAAKFANPAIRELFPWWWWCCENPNILFSANQGATSVLNEDPNVSTRWCFASGQTVPLTGSSESAGSCPVGSGGDCTFGWTSVGAIAVDGATPGVTLGYANGSAGAACANEAFVGSLSLNGAFTGDCVAFYQVLAGVWGGNGNPARGGTPPVSYQPLAAPLSDIVTVFPYNSMEPGPVSLGPFSFNGVDNLYVTRSQWLAGGLDPAIIAQIGPLPTLSPGQFFGGWNSPNQVLAIDAGALIGGASNGGVTLLLQPYDIHGNPLPSADIDMGPSLTLMIDTTPLSAASIDAVTVYNGDGTLAPQTTASSGACPAYQITTPGGGYALVHTTVTDPLGHLCTYKIVVDYGNGTLPMLAINPADRDYAQAPASFTAGAAPPLFTSGTGYAAPSSPPPAAGYTVDTGYGTPDTTSPPVQPPTPNMPGLPAMPTFAPSPPAPPPADNWTYVGGGDTIYVPIPISCCYDFQLWVSKRTTDGADSCVEGLAHFQTVNITVAAA